MNFNIHNLVLCYFAFGVPVFFTSLIIVGSLFGHVFEDYPAVTTSILSMCTLVLGACGVMLYNYYQRGKDV